MTYRCWRDGGTEFEHQEYVLAVRQIASNDERGLVFEGLAEVEWECSKDEVLWCMQGEHLLRMPKGQPVDYV